MRRRVCFSIALLGSCMGSALGQSKLPVQQAIEAQYSLTKPTADHKDMVTPGAVIDLLKDDLVLYSVTANTVATSTGTYKDGKFQYGGMAKLMNMSTKKAGTSRTFVAGEKFWLIGVSVNDDGVMLEFLSDPISDVRYKGFVKYPYPAKGVIPPADVVLATIKESIKAEPVDGKVSAQAPAAPPAPAAPAAPAEAKMADIPIPPPPADAPPAAPKEISLGQTKDLVTANFGAPTRVVKVGTKEIDYYADMKVTFVNGKVTDVQ